MENRTRPLHINSDELWPKDSGCHQIMPALSPLVYDSPVSKRLSIRFDTTKTHAIRRSTYSRWTPWRFVVALSVCRSSRSMQYDSSIQHTRWDVVSILNYSWKGNIASFETDSTLMHPLHNQVTEAGLSCLCLFAHPAMEITTLGPFYLQVPHCLFRCQRVCEVQKEAYVHRIIWKKK